MSENQETTKNLTQSILARIDTDKVEPRSKFGLLCTYSFFSVASFISIVIGAVAVAVMVFTSLNMGWEYYEMTHDNLVTFVFNIVPYVWIVVLALTILFGYYNLRHTKRGYRYSLSVAVLGIIGASVVGGFTLYFLKVGYGVDHMTHMMFPNNYKEAFVMQKEMWHEPEMGRIFGVVTAVVEDSFLVRDIENELWVVETDALPSFDWEYVQPEAEVRLIGVVDVQGKAVIGCVVLPGIKEMPPSVKEVAERRGQFKSRVAEQKVMMEQEEVSVNKRVVYEMCHELVETQLRRREPGR